MRSNWSRERVSHALFGYGYTVVRFGDTVVVTFDQFGLREVTAKNLLFR